MTKKLCSMLLVLAVLCSCFAGAFVTTASAASIDSSEIMIADWVFGETVYYRGADTLMAEYADIGITDIFLLVKGTLGKLAWQSSVSGAVMSYSDIDLLEQTCTAAKKYGIRVHAWMAAGQDSNYIASDANAIAYHFRHGTGSTVTQYVDLRDSGYRTYMRSLIKELNNYDIAGIHFDYIRYANLFYDWGGSARNVLINDYSITKAEYNAATMAMAVTANNDYGASYQVTTNSDGYYIYTASGGTTPSGVGFANALAGKGSTDALNGATKVAQMRKDNLKSFIAETTQDLSSDKLVSCAIMPESVSDSFAQASYCQDPAVLKDVCDFVAIMSYTQEYGAANTWPGTLAENCANQGLDAVAAIQTFDSTATTTNPTCSDIYEQYTDIISTRNSVNTSSSSGKVLGFAFFRAAKTTLASAYVKNSTTMNFTVHAQDELETSLTKLVFTMQNGVTISSVSNKSGWGSSTFTISTDKTKLTITNSSGILGSYGSASFDVTYSGTVSESTGACMLQAYNSSGEDYAFCNTIFPVHTHSYSSGITTDATCTTAGVMTYTCACGSSYTESIAATGHSYTAETTMEPTCVIPGILTYTCSCGSSYTEEIATGAHSYKPAYDEETGMTTYTCVNCSDSYESLCGMIHQRVETWETGEDTHFAFCYNCSVGQEYSCYFEVVERVNATCTAAGYAVYACAAHHDESTSDLVTDAFSGAGCTNTYTVTLEASCNYLYVSNLNGTHSKTCSSCGTVAETVDCTMTDGVCTVCGYTENDFTLLHFKSGSPETTWNWQIANNTDTSVSFGSDSYGSMIGVNESTVANPYFLVWPQDTCAINHTVAANDVVEVRLRINVTSNEDGVSGVIPDVRLQTGSNAYNSVTGNGSDAISMTTTDWQTVQIPIVGSVYQEGYVINRVLFDPWSTTSNIYIGAEIEIDYIYIGQPDTAPSASAEHLYFDFTNTAEAVRRYNNSVYEGNNFDLIPWAYSASRNSLPTFDYTNEGTLTISGITGNYAYAQTTAGGNALTQTPLQYTVGSNDVVEMRFKLANLTAADGATPQMKLYYLLNEDASSLQGVSFASTDSILDGEYITVSASLSSASGKLISAIRPHIEGICDDGSGTGRVIIDYIYVGPDANKPSNDDGSLYFSFDNSEEARRRYDSYEYGYFNYDLGGWGYNTARCGAPTFNNAAGTMSTVVVGSNPYLQIYAEGPSLLTRPLNFNPSKAEMVQVRLKMSGLEAYSSGEASPSFAIKFIFDDDSQAITADYLTYSLTDADLTSGEYITITLPTNDFLQGYSKITSVQVVLNDVRAKSDETAVVTFDEIYIGPKKDGINFIYFYNEDGSDCLSSSVSEEGAALSYNGAEPIKVSTESEHYIFDCWVDADGNTVNLATASFAQDTNLYATFKAISHEMVYVSNESGHIAQCECGYSYEQEAHDWDDGVITTPASCDAAGVKTYTCSVCKATETEAISAEGHNYISTVTAPTCEDQGYTTYTCSCGDSYITEYISATGHDYEMIVTAPTCEDSGYTTYTCKCGDSFTSNYTNALGHSYTTETIEATCTTAGSTVSTCANCGDTITQTIAALQHEPVYCAKTAPTCVEIGMEEHYECKNCDGLFIDADCKYSVPLSYISIATVDHNYVTDITTPATCTTDGVKTTACSGCGDFTTEVISATGHTLAYQPDLAPTCEEVGYNEHYRCSDCGICYIDAECQYQVPNDFVVLAATGHNYTSQTVAATCTSAGYTVSTCSKCSDSYTVTGSAATGHRYCYTDNGDGSHTITCGNCDYSVSVDHRYSNGTCIFCGSVENTEPKYVLDSNLSFIMSISAGTDMQVRYTILTSKVSSFDSFYIVISKDVADSTAVTTTFGLGENMTAMTPVVNSTTGAITAYQAVYTGISAKEMGDTFTATLYAVASDGSIHYSAANSSTIKSYLIGRIDSANATAAFKTMAVDMLNYGAAAQIRLGYNTENLVNAELTAQQLAYGTQTIPTAVDSSTSTGSGVKIINSVSVQSKVMLYLNCIYTPTDASTMSYVITDAQTGDLLATLPVTMLNSGKVCQGIFDDVGAKQMRQLVSITLYDGDTAVSQTLTWSIESYVAATRARTGATEAEIAMANAMLAYGDSVAAYMSESGQN